MTRDEHIKTIAIEECNELAHRISKAQRFGMDDTQPGQGFNNRDRIIEELTDLVATLDMMGIQVIFMPADFERKKAKIEKYLAYAAKCGTLQT